ncbi:MAG: ABC transporter ATP-binding protein, partial [Oscillospiraceae bacterium]|nr:ABC transporter ATP-binding protein [Oscillospiraceae bacterium]
MEITIAAKNIVKSFGSKKVLDGLSFNVLKGQIFGLLGPSGAGKTTLIKILTGQLPRDLGTAEINDLDVDKLTGADNKKFGIMMDNFGVYERLSCYDNLKIFAEIYGVKNDDILSSLKKVGLEDAKKTPAARLSKGMRSRLRLARVFMTDPDILFRDEPTSGLDP